MFAAADRTERHHFDGAIFRHLHSPPASRFRANAGVGQSAALERGTAFLRHNLELSPELMKLLILRSNLPVPRKRRVAAPLERAKPPVELMLVDPQLGSDRFGSFAAQANRLELVLRGTASGARRCRPSRDRYRS
jgi:hypothetical protein